MAALPNTGLGSKPTGNAACFIPFLTLGMHFRALKALISPAIKEPPNFVWSGISQTGPSNLLPGSGETHSGEVTLNQLTAGPGGGWGWVPGTHFPLQGCSERETLSFTPPAPKFQAAYRQMLLPIL